MAEVNWSESAINDLNEIAEYIALDNEVAAKALVQNLFAQVERLGQFPYLGRVVPELPHLPYREVVAPPCRVFYKVEQQNIYVLFVMRQERDLRRYLLASASTAR